MDFEQIREEVKEGKYLTCIHGNIYDITKFIDRHPGGKRLIKNCIGIDATCLFESYHPFTQKPHSLLEKMKVGKIKNYVVPSKFDTAFALSLKQKCSNYMKNKKCRESISNYFIIFISIILGISSHVLFLFYQNILTVLFLGSSMTYLLLSTHLASHYILSSSESVNDIVSYINLLSPFSLGDVETWSSFHVLSHHSYLNTARDFEQEAYNHFKSSNLKTKWRFRFLLIGLVSQLAVVIHRNQNMKIFYLEKKIIRSVIFILFAAWFGYFGFMTPLIPIPKRGVMGRNINLLKQINKTSDGIGPTNFVFNNEKECQYYYSLHGMSALIYLILFCYVNWDNISILFVFFWFGLVSCVTNIIFSVLQNPLHTHNNNEDVFKDDWYKHSIINSSSSSVKYVSKIGDIFNTIFGCGFFVNHTAHHCFPGICTGHLNGLQKIIEIHCKQNNVTFTKESTVIDLAHMLYNGHSEPICRRAT